MTVVFEMDQTGKKIVCEKMIIARISHFKPKYHTLFTVYERNMRLQITGRGEINFISLVNTRSSWVRHKQGPYLARSSARFADR